MLKWFAPILSFTTEEIYRLLNKDNGSSIHLKQFPKINQNWNNLEIQKNWNDLIHIRNAVNASIEKEEKIKQ